MNVGDAVHNVVTGEDGAVYAVVDAGRSYIVRYAGGRKSFAVADWLIPINSVDKH